jgi:hypothetical protein
MLNRLADTAVRVQHLCAMARMQRHLTLGHWRQRTCSIGLHQRPAPVESHPNSCFVTLADLVLLETNGRRESDFDGLTARRDSEAI